MNHLKQPCLTFKNIEGCIDWVNIVSRLFDHDCIVVSEKCSVV